MKKRIALGVVATLAGSLLAAVAPASAADYTATVSPVRVTFTSTVQDAVPYARISWAADTAPTGDTLTVSLVSAPSAAATLTFNDGAQTETASLGSPLTAFDIQARLVTGTTKTGYVDVSANTAGTYVGTITTQASKTIAFSFTTTGAPASLTAVPTSTAVMVGGTDAITVSVKDAAGNLTQPSTVDTVKVETTTGNTVDDYLLDNADLRLGKATVTFSATASGTVSDSIVFTPQGVFPSQGLTAQTVAYSISGSLDSAALDTLTVTTPSVATADGVLDTRTAQVPAGTTSVVIGFNSTTASKTYRFKLTGSSGTINGKAATTPQYVNVTTGTDKAGSLSLTLGSGLALAGETTTIMQVNAANSPLYHSIAVVQQAPAISAGSIKYSPMDTVVRKLADSTNVTVTVADQFGQAVGAGYTVRAYRVATTSTAVAAAGLLASATTAADGTASVAVTNASTLTAAGSEVYRFTVSAATLAETTASSGLTINYTATGNITDLTVSVAGNDSVTGTNATLHAATSVSSATDQLVYPAVKVPGLDGVADYAANASGTYTPAATTKYVAGVAGEMFRLTAAATTANSAVFTADAGSFVSTSSSVDYGKGKSSVTVSDSTPVYVGATKAGLHTITIVSANLTRTVSFWAYNAASDAYNVAISAPSTLSAGQLGTITITVTDMYGNPVKDSTASDWTLTSTGAALLGGYATSATSATDSSGQATFVALAGNTAGTATYKIAGSTTALGAFASAYTAPTGAPAPVGSASATVTVSATTAAADATAAQIKALQDAQAKAALDAAAAATAAATAAKANADAIAAVSSSVLSLQTTVAALVASMTAQIKVINATMLKIQKQVTALQKAVAKK